MPIPNDVIDVVIRIILVYQVVSYNCLVDKNW